MQTISKCPLRVLVVDDNKDTADTLAALVELWDHEARVAYCSTEAITIAGEFRPHVVLMDLVMPEIRGSELAREIRQSPGLERTTFIAISGHNKEVHEEF